MKFSGSFTAVRRTSVVACAALLAACGGGGDDAATADAATQAQSASTDKVVTIASAQTDSSKLDASFSRAMRSTVTVRARSSSSTWMDYFFGGNPQITVYVDGVAIGTRNLVGTGYADYQFSASNLPDGPGRIDVGFNNDLWVPSRGYDRNAIIASVTAWGKTVSATHSEVTYDWGAGSAAFDGIDVTAGTNTMLGNGALRFPSFNAPGYDQAQLLVVHAHADDEGLFGGGVLPYYAQTKKMKVAELLLVTRDNDGSRLDTRVNQMRNAVNVYAGATGKLLDPATGRYQAGNITLIEGGFVDTYGSSSNSPAGAWYSDNVGDAGWGASPLSVQGMRGFGNLQGDADGARAAARIVAREIRRFRPKVVVSVHDLEGDYGHENHTATAIATIEGYAMAADSRVDIDGLRAWQASKLYLRGGRDEDNPATIRWSDPRKTFQAQKGVGSLFHDGFELPTAGGKSPRQVASAGVAQHVNELDGISSPWLNYVGPSTVYLVGERFDNNHSEWWTLYRSTVGADPVVAPFDFLGFGYEGWARGDFLSNLR